MRSAVFQGWSRQQRSKFELVLNMRTAKVLGLNVATGLLLRADEVIE
jgi:hypothetical protein